MYSVKSASRPKSKVCHRANREVYYLPVCTHGALWIVTVWVASPFSSLKTSPKDRVIALTGGPASSMSTVTLDKLISDEQSIKAVLGIISNDNDNNEEDEEQVKKEEVWWLKTGKQWKLTNVAKNIYRNHLSCTGQQSVINAVKNLMTSDEWCHLMILTCTRQLLSY